MIKEEKLNKSIEVIHDLIIKTKIKAVNNESHEEIYNFLDDIEYLPQLILDEKDMTTIFKDELEKICEKYNFSSLLNKWE